MKLGKKNIKRDMENTLLIPEISNWVKEKNNLTHEFSNVTDEQLAILERFAKKHKKYYICNKGGNTVTLCKPII